MKYALVAGRTMCIHLYARRRFLTMGSVPTRNREPGTFRKLLAGAIGGVAASGAYALVQRWDMRAFNYPTDDFVLLGRMFTDDDEMIRRVGVPMHFVNGALLGSAYALVARDRLPGSPLSKGLTWTMIETFGLYPMAFLEDFHPGIRERRLPSYLTGKGFAQQLVRHVAYGLVLGPVTERVLRR
jgi:hypothetical protein